MGICVAHELLGFTIEQYMHTTPVLLHDLLTAAMDLRAGEAGLAPQKVAYADQIPGGW